MYENRRFLPQVGAGTLTLAPLAANLPSKQSFEGALLGMALKATGQHQSRSVKAGQAPKLVKPVKVSLPPRSASPKKNSGGLARLLYVQPGQDRNRKISIRIK
jgi:hypothetical protein